ncbi:kinase [Thraustotheca clavata]|uniref:Kinase n=1 Tax=Thraustotheca clavata TaxID=74557 RepID=A0A1W0A335_9STRA|nr:kinase [Thraustotheca clavata]
MSESHTTTIVLAIAGTLLLLILIATFMFARKYRNHYRSSRLSEDETSPYELVTMDIVNSSEYNWGNLPALKLDGDFLTPIERLSNGKFYEIWEGVYKYEPVLIKGLIPRRKTKLYIQNFINTIKTMSTCHHPCILSVIGVAWSNPLDIQYVLEFMNMGSLRAVLEASATDSFAWHHKVNCILNVAEGLAYLHNRRLIHGAVNTKNILIDTVKESKLGNIGLSKEEVLGSISSGVWWMAPEMLVAGQYSSAIDIYALGMILVELDSHRKPSKPWHLTKATIDHIVQEETMSPRFSTMCPTWIQDLAMLCIARKPNHRPSAAVVVDIIRSKIDMII